jgi:PmbA protein
MVRKAVEIAKMALNPVEGEPGTCECLLGPMTFAHLVEQLGVWSSAFYVDAEMSFLTGLLGQEAASREFTLYDDPTLAGTYGAAPFDAEGDPTRRNTIFENGVLKTYLHNTATAKKFNTSTTANAGIIVPHPFNLVVKTGGKTLDKLITGIDMGIWVTNDWYLRY